MPPTLAAARALSMARVASGFMFTTASVDWWDGRDAS